MNDTNMSSFGSKNLAITTPSPLVLDTINEDTDDDQFATPQKILPITNSLANQGKSPPKGGISLQKFPSGAPSPIHSMNSGLVHQGTPGARTGKHFQGHNTLKSINSQKSPHPSSHNKEPSNDGRSTVARKRYDHERQIRLFEDTQAMLAMNAFQVNEISQQLINDIKERKSCIE